MDWVLLVLILTRFPTWCSTDPNGVQQQCSQDRVHGFSFRYDLTLSECLNADMTEFQSGYNYEGGIILDAICTPRADLESAQREIRKSIIKEVDPAPPCYGCFYIG